MMRRVRAAVALTSVLAAVAGHASDCAALATHDLPHARITAAQLVPAQADVPEFCRVQGEAQPTADSQIGFELWLPASNWNGRYYQLGNGGFAGSIHLDGQRDFDLARQRRIGSQTLGQVLDATDPHLTRFERRRGKLLMYFGSADDLIPPQAGVDYYERVVVHMGGIVERTQAFFRLFMVPGMGHCQGGAAPHAFGQAYVAPGMHDDPEHDIRRALEAWVEQGKVPERIVEAAQVLHPYKKGE